MSKSPLLRQKTLKHDTADDADDDERHPFARFHCIWDGHTGGNHNLARPFAKLHVVLDRAIEVIAADVTGFSDPFVVFDINGQKATQKRSVTKRQTLAPTWREEFVFDVHHPQSVLTMTVWDEDFGTTFKTVDLLGLDDDLIGFLDVRLDSLPLNEWVSGWFPLGHPDSHEETITRRIVAGPSDKYAGDVRLMMRLEGSLLDEMSALCLLTPDLGVAYPSLDLGEVVTKGLALQEKANWWADTSYDLLRDMLHWPIPLLVVLLALTWNPYMLLPAAITCLPLALLAMRYEAYLKIRRKQKKTFSRWDSIKECWTGEMAGGEDIEELMKVAMASSPVAAAQSKKEVEQLKFAARQLEPYLEEDVREQLQLTQAVIKEVLFWLSVVERKLEKASEAVVLIASCVVLSVLLYIYKEWQPIIIQVGTSIGLVIALFPFSLFARSARAAAFCILQRRRLHVRALKDEALETRDGLPVIEIAKAQCMKLLIHGDVQNYVPEPHSRTPPLHHFKAAVERECTTGLMRQTSWLCSCWIDGRSDYVIKDHID
eukprot:TRINITY_DN8269_c0_g1_i2.p1 TRINITY_DN8269_c0_g1~~TRINITY_DN8269_c0_g1_i2.p1  ORF type:complete len:543 (-),score=103.58 TRINITY_DN8269_c0_g1_i2:397-2025(-)